MLRVPFLLVLVCVLCVHSHEHSYAHSHGHSHVHSHEHSHEHEPLHMKYLREANIKLAHLGYTVKRSMRTESPYQLWMETSAAILLISLAPFLLLFLLPDLTKRQNLLRVFLAFAAGGLLGDAFLHVIPHAIDRHQENQSHTAEHDHKHHLMVGLSIVAGIFLFLCVEKLIRVFQRGHGHSHGQPHGSQPAQNVTQPVANGGSQKNKKAKKGHSGDDASSKHSNPQYVQQQLKKVAKHSSGPELKVAGYLNLAADFTHNFTDGLAIGSSFLLNRNTGMITTLTVLIHELPHEIGDYAILIQSGCSARKAMLLQLTTAIGAAIGAALSLLAAGVGLDSLTTKWEVPLLTDDLIVGCVLPFTAGGLIYVAMTSVLPDLLGSEHGSGSKRSVSHWCGRITQSIAEIFALISGIAMMAALGLLEQ